MGRAVILCQKQISVEGDGHCCHIGPRQTGKQTEDFSSPLYPLSVLVSFQRHSGSVITLIKILCVALLLHKAIGPGAVDQAVVELVPNRFKTMVFTRSKYMI